MRGLWIVVLAAAVAAADDAPSARTFTVDEWEAQVAAIEQTDTLTIEKLDALRKLAAGARVERRAKILDITEGGHGGEYYIQVCDVYGGEWRESLNVPSSDADEVTTWKRWDRVVVTYTPRVESGAPGSLQIVRPTAKSLRRTPNQGVEFRANPTGSKSAADFRTWLTSYGRSCLTRDWTSAARLIETNCRSSWILTGTVTEGADQGPSCTVDLDGETLYREKVATRDREVRWTGRSWGFVGTKLNMLVHDPQVAPLLVPGAKFDALVWITPADLSAQRLDTMDGRIGWSFQLLRVKPTGAAK